MVAGVFQAHQKLKTALTAFVYLLSIGVVSAEDLKIPIIGWLNPASMAQYKGFIRYFEQGLKETGFIVGKNVQIDFRFADDDLSKLPALAQQLVSNNVSVIYANAGLPAAIAASSSTKSIPIVFSHGGNPVRAGLIENYARPTGNITGIALTLDELDEKRLEFIAPLALSKKPVFIFINPKNPVFLEQRKNILLAGRKLDLNLKLIEVATDLQLKDTLAMLEHSGQMILVTAADPLFANNRRLLINFASSRRIPAIYLYRQFVEEGGLMSYGPDLRETTRQAGIYVGRILKGEKPSNLPILRPKNFEFVINLRAAKAIGLNIPDNLVSLADEILE